MNQNQIKTILTIVTRVEINREVENIYIYNLPKDIQPPWQVWFTLVYCEFRLKTNDLAGRQVWFDPGRLWQEVVVTLPNYPTPLIKGIHYQVYYKQTTQKNINQSRDNKQGGNYD